MKVTRVNLSQWISAQGRLYREYNKLFPNQDADWLLLTIIQPKPEYHQQILLSIPVYNSNHNKKHNWIKPNTIHNQSKLLLLVPTTRLALGGNDILNILYNSYNILYNT